MLWPFLGLTACNGVVGDAAASSVSDARSTWLRRRTWWDGHRCADGSGGLQGCEARSGAGVPAPPHQGRVRPNRSRSLGGRSRHPRRIVSGRRRRRWVRQNNASIQTISLVHAQQYLSAAKQLSHQVVGDATAITRVLGCDPASGDRAACAKSFVQKVGRRAYRRPLADDEVSSLVALSATETDAHEGAALALGAILQSPSFLWRVEIGTPDPNRPGLVRLTGQELATRLSFFLLVPPDDALLDAADAGKLDTPEGVAQVTETLLGTPALNTAMHTFTSQWFRADKLPTFQRSTQIYPSFKPELVTAMSEELSRLLDDFMWKDGTSFMDFHRALHVRQRSARRALRRGRPCGKRFRSSRLGRQRRSRRPAHHRCVPDGINAQRRDLTHSARPLHPRRRSLRSVSGAAARIVPPAIMPGESEADAQQRHSADPCARAATSGSTPWATASSASTQWGRFAPLTKMARRFERWATSKGSKPRTTRGGRAGKGGARRSEDPELASWMRHGSCSGQGRSSRDEELLQARWGSAIDFRLRDSATRSS